MDKDVKRKDSSTDQQDERLLVVAAANFQQRWNLLKRRHKKRRDPNIHYCIRETELKKICKKENIFLRIIHRILGLFHRTRF